MSAGGPLDVLSTSAAPASRGTVGSGAGVTAATDHWGRRLAFERGQHARRSRLVERAPLISDLARSELDRVDIDVGLSRTCNPWKYGVVCPGAPRCR
jgi:hypothetical protein